MPSRSCGASHRHPGRHRSRGSLDDLSVGIDWAARYEPRSGPPGREKAYDRAWAYCWSRIPGDSSDLDLDFEFDGEWYNYRDVLITKCADRIVAEATGTSVPAADPGGTGSSSNNPEPAQPPAPPARVHPTLTVIETQVKLEGCPDPNFPNVCEYTMVIWLEYTTPEPSRIKCQGFLFASDERRVDDTAGAITLSLTFSDSETRPMYDLSELTASCSMVATAGEP